MRRSLARCAAVALLLVVYPVAFPAAAQEVLSTRCEEAEVVHDAQHTTSRLGRCGGDGRPDLLWHLDRIDQLSGSLDGHFSRRNRGAGVVVYVMDTGVMATHDEFASAAGSSRVVAGFDVARTVPYGASRCRSSNRAIDPCYSNDAELTTVSHGTAVASLIAGANIGVAPDAEIVSIRVMNERGLATTKTYLDGLNAIIQHAWTTNTPVRQTAIVNISGWVLDRLPADRNTDSVSYAAVEQKMRDMIGGVDANGAVDRDGRRFLFVVAANNLDGGCGASGIIDRFPAILGPAVDGIVTVGGMTATNSSWRGSCRGGVEVLAPAQNVFSATITARDEYRGRRPNQRSGTSFAAPIISGIAAMLVSEHPSVTPEELESRITSTPSRVTNPDQLLADGKVGYTDVPEPRVTVGVADGGMAFPLNPAAPSRSAAYAP